MHVSGTKLVDSSGNTVDIKGINWFGFNVGQQIVDGLWAGGADHATDFAKIVWQLPALGFNAVRLPFRWKDMGPAPGRDTACWHSSEEDVKKKATDPAKGYVNKAFRTNPAPMSNRDGWCNTYLPNNGWDRLLWVTQYFIAQGMYVVLDYQPMGTEYQPYDINTFANEWVKLWSAVSCLPNFDSDLKGRIFIDLMNEPDSMGMGWERRGDKPGTTELFLTTMDRMWQANADGLMFFVEGTGQNMWGLSWGNGFITDYNIINSNGLSDANGFFQQVITKPYIDRVIITPHLYPPSIAGGSLTGRDLFYKFSKSFGYLNKQGYCHNGQCRRYPILIGEVGSAFHTDLDKRWLGDFVKYLNAVDEGNDGEHEPIYSWMWWAYNANSGDTGGIVTDDWQKFNWEKINYLRNLGLWPWYDRP